MQTEETRRVSISYEWIAGGGTAIDDSGNITLNNSNASTTIELSENQKLDTYGFKFTCNGLNQDKDNGVEIRFYSESLNIEDSIEVYIPICDTGDIVQEVKIPIKAYKITVQLYGNWTCGYNNYIYGISTTVSTATTATPGTASFPVKGGLTVVEVDNKITGQKAGETSINCGDGLHITAEGKLSTTSDLSGSNWRSLDTFKEGFVVNGDKDEQGNITGGYWFKFLDNGNILYLNANREIRISDSTSNMPRFSTNQEEGGE